MLPCQRVLMRDVRKFFRKNILPVKPDAVVLIDGFFVSGLLMRRLEEKARIND